MLVLVRYAPEISLKSTKVKARFISRLIRNLREAFEKSGVDCKIDRQWNHMYVEMANPEGLNTLQRVFGVGSMSVIEHRCDPDLSKMEKVIHENYGARAKGEKICVRAKRSGGIPLRSKEVEIALGSALNQYAAGVDLENPGLKVHVNMRPDGVFFYTQTIKGPGGLPIGVEGKALCLISGGFDSAVAAWQMMKRGLELDYVLFNMGGQAYKNDVIRVAAALAHQWSYGYRPRLIIVDFNPVVDRIREKVKPRFSQVVLKRAFYKCASILAHQIPECPALITGEAVGQVSSQTLHNLVAIDEAADIPVLRPLIATDKEDIIRLARAIGTFHLCEKIKEYCALTPRYPVTRTNVKTARSEEEHGFGPGDYDEILRTSEMVELSSWSGAEGETSSTFIDHIPEEAVVIDVRLSHQYQAWHYPGAIHKDLDILTSKKHTLHKDKTYVLYCPFGLQTSLIAERLQGEGLSVYSFKGGTRAIQKYCQSEGLDW